MNKIYILLLLLFLSNIVSAQTVDDNSSWKLVNIVDDFGDPTGDSVIQQIVVGKFTNSATADSKCKYVIQSYPKVVLIDIFPYDKGVREKFVTASQQLLKIKSPDGKKSELKVFAIENGQIVLNKKEAKEFKQLLKQHGTFKVVLNYVDNYSEARYEFEFVN